MTVNYGPEVPAAAAAANITPVANPKWKAVGFLNFEMPADTKSGVAKLGAIALTMDEHSELLEFLLEDPTKTERRVQQVAATFTVNYRSAEKKAKGYKLIDAVDAAAAEKQAA